MLDLLGESNAVALVGLMGGFLLGLAARRGRFCTLGAIEDLLYSRDDRRMRMWFIAIGSAIVGVHLSIPLLGFDPAATLYLARGWNPIGSIAGGLAFGYGMALAGNCGYGALARLGGGDLRSLLIVIVMGLSAYIVLSGPLAPVRVWLFPVGPDVPGPQGFSQLLDPAFGAGAVALGLFVGAVFIVAAVASRQMLEAPSMIVWGLVVGVAIVSGWIGTHHVATHGFDGEPVRTHTFARPLGDTLFWLMSASGDTLNFSVGSVAGVLLGALAGSYSKGHFRWEACEDPRELGRQMAGAAIMGAGAIVAVGCSIGQGISAFSVLAYSAPVTFAAIFLGAALGLRQLISGWSPAE